MYFGGLNISNLNSKLYLKTKEMCPENIDKLKFKQFTERTITDFNIRNVTVKNINKMLDICTFLAIDDGDKYVYSWMSACDKLRPCTISEENYLKYPWLISKLRTPSLKTIIRDDLRHYFSHEKIRADNPDFCDTIVLEGTIGQLQSAINSGYELKSSALDNALKYGKVKFAKFILGKNVKSSINCSEIVRCGNLSCIELNHLNCCCKSEERITSCSNLLCSEAAWHGKLDILKFGFTFKKCVWNSFQSSPGLYAGIRGHIECLKYIINNCDNCSYSSHICMSVVKENQFEAFKVLYNKFKDEIDRDNGLHWFYCTQAARNGNLELLMFLCEHGFEMNGLVCLEAAEHGHFECLKYAHSHGCPLAYGLKSCVQYAEENKDFQLLSYCIEHGYSWKKIKK